MKMPWHLSYRADPRALPLADRHYTRQAVGSPQFVTPGRCVVLLTARANALWVTSWPEYAQHEWVGAWVCSIFRNESGRLSSLLIRQAVAATRSLWPVVPALGMITFVDPEEVRPKRDPGRCFLKAGFVPAGQTKGGLLVLQLLPDQMPEAAPPLGEVGTLFASMAYAERVP